MLGNIKDKFLNYSFGLILSILTIFAIFEFHDFMDYYEIFILLGSAITFTWMGNMWPNFKNLFLIQHKTVI